MTEDSATGYATYEKDERIAQKTLNSDGSYDIAHFEVSGLAYASYEDVFSKGGAKLAEQRDLKTGAGNLVLDTGGLTVSSSSGAFNVADATDTFALAAFIKQSITATGEKGETFDFGTGFVDDRIAGFVAGRRRATMCWSSALHRESPTLRRCLPTRRKQGRQRCHHPRRLRQRDADGHQQANAVACRQRRGFQSADRGASAF